MLGMKESCFLMAEKVVQHGKKQSIWFHCATLFRCKPAAHMQCYMNGTSLRIAFQHHPCKLI